MTPKPKRSPFYVVMGLIALFAVIGGFATTFILPVSRGTFKAPFVVYLHGALALSWVLLFLFQSLLLHYYPFKFHRAVGKLGLFIAVAAAITLIPVGKYQVDKDFANGLGETAKSTILGMFTSGILFLSLVFAGIYFRKKPQIHKRLLLLATLFFIWPAWFRFRHYFPSVPRPDFWFGVVLSDLFILAAMVREKIAFHKIHPALLYTGSFIIIENVIEVMLFDTYYWRIISNEILEFFPA